ncbi:1605_t:CDS:2, partial [Cetraspora pellucida]
SMSITGKTPHAVYCICGITNEDRHAVLLVPKEELEETKQKYKTLTSIHIYSMEEHRPKDGSALVITDYKPTTDESALVITDCKSTTDESALVITDCKPTTDESAHMIIDHKPTTDESTLVITDNKSNSMEIDQEQSPQLLSKKQALPCGKRKVSKKRIYQDAKGFKVSEDTYEWESFSEGECDPRQTGINVKIKPERSSIKNSVNKRGKRKGDDSSQKSLLNFFGKI